ncbi:TerD family protein [Streptomyces sp. NPDC008150]|uniref:TerD family protein n=1 Tax=Streptomyces sp. NPDC008150 TaxID=3364816 RepID=UPI0036F14299
MTAELVRGQNHPLSRARLEIRVSAGTPVVAAATLGDERGTVHGAEWVAHPGAHVLPGVEVSRQAAADHRLAVDLGAVPENVHRVTVLLALPEAGPGPVTFGGAAAPFVAVTGLDGAELVSFTLIGLDAETAVTALELYRRQGAWKVRAVGQGYAGGLAELFTDHGLAAARPLATAVQEAVAGSLARSVSSPPPRTAEGDRERSAASPTPGHDDQRDQQGPARVASAPEHAVPEQRTTSAHAGSDASGPYGSPASQGVPAAGAGGARADGDPAPAAGSAPSPGGPVDYSHPGRRTSPAAPAPAPAADDGAGRPPEPVAGDATGWSMDERLYNQVWGMFEDLARSAAAYRSAVDFADSRREKDLDDVLSDPRNRIGGQGDAARAAAHARYADLAGQARAAFERDLAQLTAESRVVEDALPAPYAAWHSAVWQTYRVPMEIPMAVRLGDLNLPEAGPLRIPMLLRLPLERGLWIDSGRPGSIEGELAAGGDVRRLAMETAVSHAARLLAVYPPGEFSVYVLDPAGSAARPLEPLTDSAVLAAPPGRGATGVSEILTRLTQRVDLVQMAVRGGASEALPPDLDTAEHLLIVNDFPHGFDDRSVTQLRYLADEGPAVGVHLMLVADREDASAYGPLLDPLWRSLLRLTPVPEDHLADPWVGHAWTYEPAPPPAGSPVLRQVLGRVAEARRSWNR